MTKFTKFGVLTLMAVTLVSVPDGRAQDKVGTTAAPFLGIGMGARSGALGGAYVAVAEGPSALYWNVAGITQSSNSQLELSYAVWFDDAAVQQAAFVLALGGFGHFGVHVTSLDYGEMEVTTIENPEGTGELFTPRDLAVGVSFARALTDRFSVGGTGKLITQKIWNENAVGGAMDLGVFYRTDYRNLRIGAAMSNFGTDMSLSGKDLRQAHDIDPNREGNNPRLPALLEVDRWALPLSFRVGVAMDVIHAGNQRLLTAIDALHPNDNSESANFGLEYLYSDLVSLRAGYRQAFSEVTEDGGWTLGAGVQYALGGQGTTLRFDYVYQQYQEGRLDAPQMFSLGIDF